MEVTGAVEIACHPGCKAAVRIVVDLFLDIFHVIFLMIVFVMFEPVRFGFGMSGLLAAVDAYREYCRQSAKEDPVEHGVAGLAVGVPFRSCGRLRDYA